MAAPPRSDTAELYDTIASSYQRWWAPVIAPAALPLLDLVDEVVVDRPRAVLIDVGAGIGTLTRGAVARWPGVRLIAVDASDGMLDVGRAEAGRILPTAGLRRLRWMRGVAGFGRVKASKGVVEHQWSPDDFLAYAVQCEEQPLFKSLDPPKQTRLVGLWRTRSAGLGPADLLVRDTVGHVTGWGP